MNAALKHICCCTWSCDVRIREDIHCAVHGQDATAIERRRLERMRAVGLQNVTVCRTELITWIRRYRHAKKRAAEIERQLKELYS